jgi:hypothetical protein
MEDVEPVHLVLMGNTKKSNDKNILHVFDLKGSMINREVLGKNLKNTATLKDINLLKLKGQSLLQFRQEDIDEIMKHLELDAKMLRDNNIMDYSLLLAIEKHPESREHANTLKMTTTSDFIDDISPENIRKHEALPHKWVSRGGRYIYHIAIIDYL